MSTAEIITYNAITFVVGILGYWAISRLVFGIKFRHKIKKVINRFEKLDNCLLNFNEKLTSEAQRAIYLRDSVRLKQIEKIIKKWTEANNTLSVVYQVLRYQIIEGAVTTTFKEFKIAQLNNLRMVDIDMDFIESLLNSVSEELQEFLQLYPNNPSDN